MFLVATFHITLDLYRQSLSSIIIAKARLSCGRSKEGGILVVVYR